MRKIIAFLLIFLMLGPTLAMCSCCPEMAPKASGVEISASDCCCSAAVIQSDPVAINDITNSKFVFSRSFFQTSLHRESVQNVNHDALLQVPFNSEQSPHQLKDLPLYLSNLVLRI